MIVDSHQHFWRLDRGDYDWLRPELGVLYRDYLPEHLAPLMARFDVAASVLVQAAATEDETRFLLQIAAAEPTVVGVVGWVDFAAKDAPIRIRSLAAAAAGRLKGLRPMTQDIADPRWILRPDLDAAFRALIEYDFAFDALVRPVHLGFLRERLRQHPTLRVVIDHCGKPNIASEEFQTWSRDMERLAQETSAFCKLSGLLTETGGDVSMTRIDPYVSHVFACFGPERILWGSDWPVINLVADYGSWLVMARELVSRYAPGCECDVFGANAIALYRLDTASVSTQKRFHQRGVSE